MNARFGVRLAWSVWAVSLALWIGGLVIWALEGAPPLMMSADSSVGGPFGVFLRFLVVATFVSASTCSALIAAARPADPLGWLASASTLMVALGAFTPEYATAAGLFGRPNEALPGATAVAWLAAILRVNILPMIPALLVFPTGRLPSRRWAPVLWLAMLMGAVLLGSLAFMPGPLPATPNIENPLGVRSAAGLLAVTGVVSAAGLAASIVLVSVSLLVRLRRSEGEERQQIKWVVFAAVIWLSVLVGLMVAPTSWQPAGFVVAQLALLAFVGALAIALLKFRLWDIDVVINRTLVYGALAALITIAYVAVVVGIGALLGTSGQPDVGLSLVATAVVAITFQQLRDRLQRLANQLVYGQRASPYEVLATSLAVSRAHSLYY